MSRIASAGLAGAVVRTGSEVHLTKRGWIVPPTITLSPEQMEQLRQGWLCPACWTVQDEALPQVCKTVWRDTGEPCGFPIRDRLHAWLETHFRGEEELWPDRSEELGSAREREIWTPSGGISVPWPSKEK